MKFVLAKKVGMSQCFRDNKVIPVSLVFVPSLSVTQVKTVEKDGYQAVQVGASQSADRIELKREFRFSGEAPWKVGDQIKADVFSVGDRVKVSGYSKGKGFQGAVKRWGFSGRKASHGGKGQVRTLGSVGSMFPQRVIKGRKMPGQMGHQQTSVRNLEIVEVDQQNNLLAIKGAIPGPKHSLLMIQSL